MVVGKSIIFCKFLKYSFDNNIISCCPPEKSPNNIRPKLLRRPQQIQSWVKEWPRGKMKIFVSIGPIVEFEFKLASLNNLISHPSQPFQESYNSAQLFTTHPG